MGRRVAIASLSVMLASSLAVVAQAQDEMPKEDAQQPKSATPTPAEPPPAAPEEQEPTALPPGTMLDQPFAMLQGLDKITARIKRLPVKVGETVSFGTLAVEVDACRKAPPEDPPESAAFLKITDAKPGETAQIVFSGWMFASSPALSAMDHPVYDIGVVDCAGDSTTAAAAPTP